MGFMKYFSSLFLFFLISGCSTPQAVYDPVDRRVAEVTSSEQCSLEKCSEPSSNMAATIVKEKIKPFTSDGCSVAPDRPLVPWGNSWAHCCVAHDLTYWRGGSVEERKKSDRELVSCINKVVGQQDSNPSSLGWTYWLGVRVGGAPGSRHPWRWGYGWSSEVLY
ncbi:MAG: hypothetical protein IT287_05550, partial [Bdellovibrionaceae bacterium]|nr:hypothetical protein [Pseudobdellovibrionaceae bacterium]